MASTRKPQYTVDDYTIACICPRGIELAPVEAMLDEIHQDIPRLRDQNAYTYGNIGEHRVVIAVLPENGTNAAARVSAALMSHFPALRFGLLVGTGSGVPGNADDIRLGDVVVSQAKHTFGGVVQYDFGKKEEGGRFRRTGMLNQPPQVLSAHVRKLESRHRREDSQVSNLILNMIDRFQKMQTEYAFPISAHDDLFLASYPHQGGGSCDACDREQTVLRLTRPNNEPYIHYGIIGSANVEISDAQTRDQLRKEMDVICLETEAAGLMNHFPCLVIRGICDYADSHKNKRWQPYAAAVAAAYMKELLMSIPPQQVVQIKSVNKYFEIPHLLSPVFTGHEEICQHLDNALSQTMEASMPIQRRFVLFGLGGSGKTQVCLRYAQTHRHRYWGVFWIDASTSESIQQSMLQIARLLDTDPSLDNVKRILAHASQTWLLIFDNADDPNLSLSTYIPPGDHGDVVITSRNPACHLYNTVGSHEVGPLTSEASQVLLYKLVHGHDGENDEASDHGKLVVEALGCHALAVTHAGAYIRETSCSFVHYLELYKRRRQEVFEYSPRHTGTDYPHTIYTTWLVSLEKIQSIKDATSKFAINMLKLLCFYHHDQIPVNMFYYAWRKSILRKTNLDWQVWPYKISDEFDLQHSLRMSTTLLASFSLITRYKDITISLHPLVREWCYTILDNDERKTSCRRAVSLLATSVSWKFENAHYQYRRSLISHVHACLRLYGSSGDGDFDQNEVDDWEKLALVLQENGFEEDAIPLMEHVVGKLTTEMGEQHRDTLRSTTSLALGYKEVGRYAEALDLMEYVVRLQTQALGQDHAETLSSMHDLAIHCDNAGQHEKALQLMEQVVKVRKQKLGDHHPNTLMSMNNLANCYGEAGQKGFALPLMQQVVNAHRTIQGEEHPNTLISMHNLATLHCEMGQKDQALELVERVLYLRESNLCQDHPGTLRSLHLLAYLYHRDERKDEAQHVGELVVRLRRAKLGENHPETLRSKRLLQLIKRTANEDLLRIASASSSE